MEIGRAKDIEKQKGKKRVGGKDIKEQNLICLQERECPSGENANHMSPSLFHLFECSFHLIFKLKGPYRCPIMPCTVH